MILAGVPLSLCDPAMKNHLGSLALKILRWCLVLPSAILIYALVFLTGIVIICYVYDAIIYYGANSGVFWHRGDLWPTVFRPVRNVVGWWCFLPFDCLGAYLGLIVGVKMTPNRKLFAGCLLVLFVALYHVSPIIVVMTHVDLSALDLPPMLPTTECLVLFICHLLGSTACAALAFWQISRKPRKESSSLAALEAS